MKDLTGYKKALAEWGVSKKLNNLNKGPYYTHAIYDKLVFK